MSIEYLGLSSINGPLIALEGVQGAFFDEIVEFVIGVSERKIGRIIELYEDKAVIQVFEGSENMSLKNTHTRLTGHPMEIALSPDMLGRTFNGIGEPIDDLGPIVSKLKRDVNGLPLNPVMREYPRNYIRTGISAIDGLTTLIRGQKLPIFSGNGLPHDQLAAQIVKQASLGDDSDEEFAIVFAAMGVKHDVADFFRRTFEESGVADHVAMFLNLANDPVVERLITDATILEKISEANNQKVHIAKSKSGIVVKGIDDMAVRFSKCCNPVPGDEIVGFVTRGRGMTIHRTDCVNMLHLSAVERERLIDAEWENNAETEGGGQYLAELKMYANDRQGLLLDVTKVFTEEKIDVRSMNTRTSKKGTATLEMGFIVKGREQLNLIIKKLRNVEGVLDIERTAG